ASCLPSPWDRASAAVSHRSPCSTWRAAVGRSPGRSWSSAREATNLARWPSGWSATMNGPPLPDTSPVRGGEGLDWARLQAYLRQHLDPRAIAGIDLSCQMEVAQFPGGHSNLTY